MSAVGLSLWIYLVNFRVLNAWEAEGHAGYDLLTSGMCIFTQVVAACNLKVLLMAYNTSIGLALACVLSILALQPVYWAEERLASTADSKGIFTNHFGEIPFWLGIVLTLSVLVLFETWKRVMHDSVRTAALKSIHPGALELPLLHK